MIIIMTYLINQYISYGAKNESGLTSFGVIVSLLTSCFETRLE